MPEDATAQTEVPADWALKPSDIDAGEQFRLMFITSTTRNATSTDITDYNTFVSTRAAAGVTAIQTYANDFTALVSTETVNARTNTLTRATDTDAPIYWVERSGTVGGSSRAADDYADFYDGTWQNSSSFGRTESGRISGFFTVQLWTGTNTNGTTHATHFMGGHGSSIRWRIQSGSITTDASTNSNLHNILALSPVFQVAGGATNNAPTVANAILNQTATVGTALNYAFPADTFNDADSDTLTYTATQSDNSALPAWLSFAAATRTFSGTPLTADVGTVSVKVTASDGTASVSAPFDIVVSTAANNAPVFATDTTNRSFTETVGDAAVSTAGDVGAVVTATDADGDTLTYSLEGTDAAKFGIISSSGRIRTKVGANYDREAQASYSVTVKADDSNGGSDTIAVTINVDNEVEKPLAPAIPTVTATSGSTTSLDVSWMASANTGRPAITGYKVEYRPGVSGNWLTHAHTGTGTTATIANLTAATSYQVQVLAVNSDGDGPFSSPGAGTTGTALTIGMPAAAQAVALVSNVQQPNTNYWTQVSGETAQGFRTGSNTGGYTLESIEIDFLRVWDGSNLRVTLWSATSGQRPAAFLATLTNPSDLSVNSGSNVKRFTAPPFTNLNADTMYFVRLSVSGGSRVVLDALETTGEDAGRAAGWSINNFVLQRSNGSGSTADWSQSAGSVS